jgi:UDP-N-acetylmuramoylalanine--D-glutamate ligase
MQNYKQQFKGKKITVMGLGLLGRGLGDVKFLAECGADLTVTDLKTKEQLTTSLKALEKFPNIKYVLGGHRLEDFKGKDMIIKAAVVSLDSIFIAEARSNGIPIEMDVSLFAKMAPGVMLIGVTGTRGKSITTTLIYKILSAYAKASARQGKQKDKFWSENPQVFLGGNLRGIATLPLLKKVKNGDILVCELDSWQLQGFGDDKISPHISVFTTFMPDHMNYYKNNMEKYFNDKANIFRYQNINDILIIRPGMKEFIKKKAKSNKVGSPDASTEAFRVKGKFIVINTKETADWKFNVPGIHHRENMVCAVEVAKQLGIPLPKIKKEIESFKNLEGRLQLLRTYKGIKIYNDNNATTPEATSADIEALANLRKSDFLKSSARKVLAEKKIVLICGGSDKNLPLENFVETINKYCKAVVTIPGTGTEKLLSSKQKVVCSKVNARNLKDAIKNSLGLTSRNDIILFSPAFASFGVFNNEYERNDLFVKIVKGLK